MKTYRPAVGELVKVDWVDPWSHGGWVEDSDVEAAETRDLACLTVGWVVRVTADRLVLASSMVTTDTKYGELFVVPHRVIDAVTVLRPAPKTRPTKKRAS